MRRSPRRPDGHPRRCAPRHSTTRAPSATGSGASPRAGAPPAGGIPATAAGLLLGACLLLAAALARPRALAAQENGPSARPDPQEALADYDSLVEASLDVWRVPGVAVTVVVDGEVLVAGGWGVRDRASGEPVTARTFFPIGSATKAFTSLLVADLVEEGELAWDEPVGDVLPGFRLHDDYATLHATPVDLLSHRTGVPRHDLAWISGGSDPGFERAEAMRKLRHFRPSAGFRATFQYNNWMYMAAGRMAGSATGTTWERALRHRLLEPMGMERTTFRVDSALADPDHSAGYRTQFTGPDGEPLDEPVLERAEHFDPGPLGPAGSLISTAEDMAYWLELQMSGGRVDGRRVVPEAAVRATHARRIAVGGEIEQLVSQPELSGPDYALGWFVQHYRGRRLIHHAGGINGFSSLVAVLPDVEIGVSVLTNNENAALTFALAFHTLDRLLGLEPRDWNGRYRGVMEKLLEALRASSPDTAPPAGEPDHPVEAYTGRYTHPGYGGIEVRSDGGALEAAFHGFTLPLEHRAHDVFRGRAGGSPLGTMEPAFHFRTDATGGIRAVAVPLEPRLDEPILFEKAPDGEAARVSRETLESYTGAYAVAGVTVEVRLRGDGTLVLDQPGRPTLELTPAGADTFEIRQGAARAAVEFVREDGRVTGIVLRQGGRTFRGEKEAPGGG